MFTRLVFAIQSLTRIPICNIPWDEYNFGRSTAYFTIVGLMIGALLSAVYEIACYFYPPLIAAGLLLAAELMLTGGMHLDGFMDSMDGLFSGRPRERKLEIMRDSRVGANGVMAAAILFLLKFSLLANLPKPGWAVLTLMPAVGRGANLLALIGFPYARPEGLGKAYQKYTTKLDAAFAFAVLITAALILFGLPGGLVIAGLTFVVYATARQMSKTLGGLTGDTYGALIELTEVLFLLLIYVVPQQLSI